MKNVIFICLYILHGGTRDSMILKDNFWLSFACSFVLRWKSTLSILEVITVCLNYDAKDTSYLLYSTLLGIALLLFASRND